MENTIVKNILMKPSSMYDFDNEILQKLRHSVVNDRKEYGYMIDITDIEIEKPIPINHSSGMFDVKVSFMLKSILPKKDDVFKICISDIIDEGVIGVYGEMKVIVPANTLDYKRWSIKFNQLYDGEKKISIGDWISVRITHVKFNKGHYQCVGIIV